MGSHRPAENVLIPIEYDKFEYEYADGYWKVMKLTPSNSPRYGVLRASDLKFVVPV